MELKNDFDIKLKEHRKLYILLKDKIIFESELEKNKIRFYSNLEEQPMIEEGIRYFLLESDMKKIDEILIKNRIVANSESNPIIDFNQNGKMIKLSIIVTGIVIAIIMIFALIERFS